MGDATNAGGRENLLHKILHVVKPRKISAKIFIYFIVIALIPMLIVSFVLTTQANDQLLKNARSQQTAVASDLANRVDNYIANSTNVLAYNGRLFSAGSFNEERLIQSLEALFTQNASLRQISMITEDGQQRTLTLQDDGKVKLEYADLGLDSREAFQETLNFMINKPYLISIGRDADNNPQIGIGIPILKEYAKPTTDIFTSQSSKTVDGMLGAIVGYYDAANMLEDILSVKVGDNGYAYIVESTGNLVIHPDKKFLDSHTTLKDTQAVGQFIAKDYETRQTVSEKEQDVISTPAKTSFGWAVIVQEPVSSIYANINAYIQLAAIVGISAIAFSVLIGIFFSRQLTEPIKQLTSGARRLSKGEFNKPIEVKSNDELKDLANTFNRMSMSINKLVEDLKTNNLRLMVEQSKLNNMISSVSDGVIAIDRKGNVVSMNPPAARLIDQQPELLTGKKLVDLYHWQHDEKPFVPDLTKPGISHYPELTLKQGDQMLYMELVVAVLENQDGNISAIITIHDQTETRELSFMKLDFVAIAAHELRTPLTVVRGYLDLLNTGAAKEMSIFHLENLQKAIVGANQLRELINKLLNIARIERGDMEIFIEKLNIAKLVKENIEQHQPVAEQKQQRLIYTANTDNAVYAPADPASIVEVVNNLVGNALKYTGKGGEIKVNLLAGKDEVTIEVMDNGPSIPEDMRDKLFTKFYRAERSLISGSRGTGLGLFISKTIIELQDGKIGIKPDMGRGSTFYFTLPIYVEARDDPRIAKESSGGVRGWFKKRPTN